MKGLDLSKFKKTGQDKKSATLKHPDGHEIRIAVSGLSPDMKKRLAALPLHQAEGDEIQSFEKPLDPSPTPPPQMDETQDPEEPEEEEPSQTQPQPPQEVAPEAGQSQAPEQAPPAADIAPPQAKEDVPDVAPISSAHAKMQDQFFQKDLDNGHITPKTYADLMPKDTLGKVGTIFGMLLAGAGSGLTGQPNALLEMMNKQISNDLEAQKSSKSNAINLYKLNLEHQLNEGQLKKWVQEGKLSESQANLLKKEAEIKSTLFTQMQEGRIYLHHLVQTTNKLPVGSPQRQEAEQKLSMLYQKLNEQNSSLSDQAEAAGALYRQGYGQTGDLTQPEIQFQQHQAALRTSGNGAIADDLAARHMPGIPGQASVPLTQEDRSNLAGSQALVGSLQRLKEFAKNNPHPIKGSRADIEGRALAAQVQGDFRMATHGGVYKEGEQNFINQVVPGDPTSWSPFAHVTDKIDTVINETAARGDQFAKSKGFQGFPGGSASSNVAQNKPSGSKQPVERQTADGRVALFDPSTKQFLKYKDSSVAIRGK